MKRIALCLTFLLAAGIAGCGDDDGAAPLVSISGDHAMAVGASQTLSASTAGGTDSAYAWSSSNTSVATVDSATGEVTAIAAGEAQVTATGADTGASGQHAIVVASPVVTVSGSGVVLVGGTTALTATTANGTDSTYSWSSSDEGVATVASDGTVTGVGDGDATITATGDDTGVAGTLSMTVSAVIPNYDGWVTSGHADRTAEAFRHWDEDDPAEIPTTCAKCHSSPGFLDFIGHDGTDPGVVDNAAPIGSVIDCQTCHNATADAITSVTFPSGAVVEDVGTSGRCMTCHQGRSSSDTVDAAITAAGVGEDVVSSDLSFINIHYYAAGATLQAGKVRGGYEYADELGAVYDWRFRHVPGYDSCTGCHNPHSLEIRIDDCKTCHTGVTDVASLKEIRMIASAGRDYDGDGDLSEGIYGEMTGLSAKLLANIKTYTTDNTLGAICYDSVSYPYWFKDTDANGTCEAGEANYGNRFDSWTPRLLKAAYNYQVSKKDPGAFAHNAKYIIQLLHDSLQDLNEGLTTADDLSALVRNDPGHFNGAAEAARHWDEDAEVSASCSRCHSGSEGFRFFIKYGVGTEVPEQDNGLDCVTCHDDIQNGFNTLVTVDEIRLPGGVTFDTGINVNNMCTTCHAGRTGKADIDASIAANRFRFLNVHYKPSGAVKLGGDGHLGYEYTGKTYAGQWDHRPGNDCTFCHDPVMSNHSFRPEDVVSKCTDLCHTAATVPREIRGNPFFPGTLHAADYDGDGNSTEPLYDEIANFKVALYTQIQSYASSARSSAICYDPDAYPYWFKDTNSSGGPCDPSEANFGNQYGAWDGALMKAAHNYQISQKEKGAWAHNFDYMVQLMYDSIEDLGGAGAVSTFTRP